jgi:UMF1 family MFS transporter
MNKKTKNAWAFYDWANSVYSLVISTAIFPIYFESVTKTDDGNIISFLGHEYENMAIYSYSISAAFLIVAIISPILSGIADRSGKKKSFLKFFCYLGAASCSSLFFFEGGNIYFGLIMSILASVGFWGSLVFYNAYLPEIALPEEQDALSARGFSLGYFGAALLLIINLIMIQKPELFGIADTGLATRVSFLLVGIWWAGFAQYTFKHLPENPYHHKTPRRYIFRGYQELQKVVHQLRGEKSLRRFLYSFFFYSIGVQTVMYMAAPFGTNELQLDSSKLILTILIIQFVGILGAWIFSKISERFGNLQSIKASVVIWAFICFFAYTLRADDALVELKFYIVGGLVGLVMGGIQAMSRSTYSKLLPETEAHASFFSFYDVSEKIAIVIGTITYGWLIQLTGSMRLSALSLALFFVIGFVLLLRIKRTQYVY